MRGFAVLGAVAGVALLASALVAPATVVAQRVDPKKAVKAPPKPPPRAVKTTPPRAAKPPSPKTDPKRPGRAKLPSDKRPPPKDITGAPPPSPAAGDCPPTQVKIDGRCRCPPGLTWTGQRCEASAAAGDCPPTQVKIDGRCQCPPGLTWTGQRCGLDITPSAPDSIPKFTVPDPTIMRAPLYDSTKKSKIPYYDPLSECAPDELSCECDLRLCRSSANRISTAIPDLELEIARLENKIKDLKARTVTCDDGHTWRVRHTVINCWPYACQRPLSLYFACYGRCSYAGHCAPGVPCGADGTCGAY